MEQLTDASGLYEVERRAVHAERPGFRISELQISTSQFVPWHLHTITRDTFYVLAGVIEVRLRSPAESVRLEPGETLTVEEGRPHHVVNAGAGSATFLVMQGIGKYDYVPIDFDDVCDDAV